MSSPSKPTQVPDKDVLCDLTKGNKYREIESYLDSSDYTRETKIEWILYPVTRDAKSSRRSLFHAICESANCPMYIIEKVFNLLGSTIAAIKYLKQ